VDDLKGTSIESVVVFGTELTELAPGIGVVVVHVVMAARAVNALATLVMSQLLGHFHASSRQKIEMSTGGMRREPDPGDVLI
jgi:hypothetical protein